MVIFSKQRHMHTVFLLLLAMLGLVACGGEDDDANTQAVISDSENADSTERAVAEVVPLSESLLKFEGRIAVVRGTTLLVHDLSNTTTVELFEDVHPQTIRWITLGQDRVFFNAGSARNRLYEIVAVGDTLQVAEVVRVPSEFSFPISLSPDGNWVIVAGFPSTQLGRTDGSNERYTLVDQAEFGFTLWLEDNRVLVLTTNDGNTFVGEVVNPTDRTQNEDIDASTVVDIIELTLNSNIPADVLTLNELTQTNFGVGLAYVPATLEQVGTDFAVNGPAALNGAAFTGDVPLCEPWDLQRVQPDGTVETLLNMTDTLFLVNPYQLEDGTVFVEHWYLEDCEVDQRFVDLLRITPDGEVDVIIPNMNPSQGIAYASWLGRVANRTQLSPDGTAIAWLGGDIADGYTTVNIHDIATGQNVEIIRTEANPTNGASFFNADALRALQWLPPLS